MPKRNRDETKWQELSPEQLAAVTKKLEEAGVLEKKGKDVKREEWQRQKAQGASKDNAGAEASSGISMKKEVK